MPWSNSNEGPSSGQSAAKARRAAPAITCPLKGHRWRSWRAGLIRVLGSIFSFYLPLLLPRRLPRYIAVPLKHALENSPSAREQMMVSASSRSQSSASTTDGRSRRWESPLATVGTPPVVSILELGLHCEESRSFLGFSISLSTSYPVGYRRHSPSVDVRLWHCTGKGARGLC